LYINIRIHPSSGFLLYYWRSPVNVVLAKWSGEELADNMPDWVRLVGDDDGISFWQPRGFLVELMGLVTSEEVNSSKKVRILEWCNAISVSP
jgi:hypothetical protein